MNRSLNALWRGALLAACLTSTPASASVVIATTRVIFPAPETEVTVKLSHEGQHPSLVQAWIDDGRPQAPLDTLQLPFSLMPALFRLEPGKAQTLRLFHDGEALPSDRETLYWLNVLEVPPKASGNALQVSLRTRIKLLYRPVGLSGKAADAHGLLTWRLLREGRQWHVQAHNPSPFFVNLGSLSLRQGERSLEGTPTHLPPLSSTRFTFEGAGGAGQPASQVIYTVIDDYGGVSKGSAVVDLSR
ncbi:fimbria/pilus periplasmic chaperone [Pseudomonas entomophila]|uniref:fimbrial biogenesis chaperone n=1 Tax=Pseudomonas entomophila TaxID=312306 RepID=UPI0023D8AA4C|nr:fimbria/pilus periplasmic chaperone [Pseudomonas entomophila]MDF0731654.1 fimbria/pilus periplasmic chaperone [Pseudomonas entomophila]